MRRTAVRCAGLALLLCLLPALAIANPDQLLQRGIALLNQGEVEEAIRVLHQGERGLVNPDEAAGLLGEAYLRLGMQRLSQGASPAAREAFAEAKRYLPDDYRPWQAAALGWMHDGQSVAAIGELNEALAMGGDRPDLLLLLGRAHYAAGDLDQAEAAWVLAAEHGAGDAAAPLLDKVRRERRAEQGMSRNLSGRFTLAYAAGVSDALAGKVLDELENAYQAVGADLGYYPEADIPVLLYAREDFGAVTRSPEWAGGVYDGKIRVPLGGIDRMSAPLKAVLHHEYAHVVVRFLAKGRAPVWLNEGIAEVAGRRQFAPMSSPAAPPRQHLSEAALDRPFSELPVELVLLAYQRSYEKVSRLVGLCGWPPVGELLQRLGKGEPWDSAVGNAFAPCGYDWPRLQVELTGELH